MAGDSQLQEVPFGGSGGGGGDDGESVDLHRFYRAIYHGKFLIASIVFFALAALAGYFVLVPDKFIATAQILIDIQQPRLITRDIAAPGQDMTRYMIGPVTDSQVEILQSTRLAERVIRATGLENDPDYSDENSGLLPTIVKGSSRLIGKLFGNAPDPAMASAESPEGEAQGGENGMAAAENTDGGKKEGEGSPKTTAEAADKPEEAKADTQQADANKEEGQGSTQQADANKEEGQGSTQQADANKEEGQGSDQASQDNNDPATEDMQTAGGGDAAGEQEGAIPTAVIDQFLANLEVNRKGLTLVLLVRYTDIDPVRAAELANAVAETYLADQREERYEVTRHMSRQLERRMTELRDQVLSAQRRVEEFRDVNKLHTVGGLTIGEREIAETVSQLIVARNEVANKRTALQQMEVLAADPNAVMSISPVLESPVIRDLRRQAAEVSRKLATVITQFGENDNQAVTARAELRDVRNEIGLEIKRILQSARNDYEVAKSRVKFYEDSLNQLMNQFAETNRLLIQLSELEREANVTRDVYISLLSRQKETNVRAGILYPDARIFDYAAVPRHPAGPRKIIILALTLFGSIAVGVTMAILRDHIRSVLHKQPQPSPGPGVAQHPEWRRRSA